MTAEFPILIHPEASIGPHRLASDSCLVQQDGVKWGESDNCLIIQHLLIHLSGMVQGVGFRPFIYNLARQFDLVGSVQNNSQGVNIHAQGKGYLLRTFVKSLQETAPKAACIDTINLSYLPLSNYGDFRILPSERLAHAFTSIPPDLALCSECRHELLNETNRRFSYPFINCVNCGPRFTIIRDLPYDRPLTTMSSFDMCPECHVEYTDPADRRFHAQPVACSRCGPELTFLEADSNGWNSRGVTESSISFMAEALRNRKIALIHGIGGFHLACDARDEALVRELRERKHRDEKPFALMFPSLEYLDDWCEVSGLEQAVLTSPQSPIVLLKKRADCPVAPAVAPLNPFLGVMLPYSPLHLLIMSEFGHPLVMTSANIADEPVVYRLEEALDRLRSLADVALVHNREIHVFADDSVTRVVSGSPRIIRRSRGYVPDGVHVPVPFPCDTLAFGPQLKNTFCLGKKEFAFLSQHIGDMDTEQAFTAYNDTLEHFLHLFDANIGLCACDLHPDYTTTRFAEEWCDARDVPLVRVQHHHAHLVACLAENGETAPAIGLCLDGTGYGSDGTIWGGEVLVGDANGFERAGHLQQVAMPGGEQAVKEPWRMALAWLHETFGDSMFNLQLKFLNTLRSVVGEKAMETLLNRNLIADIFPTTSSLGRLFDAVAAILFFGTHRQYEGQAAMQLEWKLSPLPETPYPFDLLPTTLPTRSAGGESKGGDIVLSPIPMFHALTTDVESGVSPEIISRRFHEGIVDGFARMCEIIRETSGLGTVALSGGCFQNAFLHTHLEERLTARGFRVLTHHKVPANDGGVALGQAVIANAVKG